MALFEAHPQHIGGVLAQAREHLRVHIGDTARGVAQPLAVGVFAEANDNLAHGVTDAR